MSPTSVVEISHDLAAVVDPVGYGGAATGPGDIDGGERVEHTRKCRLHAAENDHRERCQRDNPRVLHSPPSLGEHDRDETGPSTRPTVAQDFTMLQTRRGDKCLSVVKPLEAVCTPLKTRDIPKRLTSIS